MLQHRAIVPSGPVADVRDGDERAAVAPVLAVNEGVLDGAAAEAGRVRVVRVLRRGSSQLQPRVQPAERLRQVRLRELVRPGL